MSIYLFEKVNHSISYNGEEAHVSILLMFHGTYISYCGMHSENMVILIGHKGKVEIKSITSENMTLPPYKQDGTTGQTGYLFHPNINVLHSPALQT